MSAPHHSNFYWLDALPNTQPTVSKHWWHKHTHNSTIINFLENLGYLQTASQYNLSVIMQNTANGMKIVIHFHNINATAVVNRQQQLAIFVRCDINLKHNKYINIPEMIEANMFLNSRTSAVLPATAWPSALKQHTLWRLQHFHYSQTRARKDKLYWNTHTHTTILWPLGIFTAKRQPWSMQFKQTGMREQLHPGNLWFCSVANYHKFQCFAQI